MSVLIAGSRRQQQTKSLAELHGENSEDRAQSRMPHDSAYSPSQLGMLSFSRERSVCHRPPRNAPIHAFQQSAVDPRLNSLLVHGDRPPACSVRHSCLASTSESIRTLKADNENLQQTRCARGAAVWNPVGRRLGPISIV